jgi:hypothetical protein
MIEDRCDGMRATGMPGRMPQSDHEDVAAAADDGSAGGTSQRKQGSFTGQYLKPLLERASVQPMGRSDRKDKPHPTKKGRRCSSSEAEDDDQSGGLIKRMKPDLIAAK